MDDIKDLVSVEVLHPIYENSNRYMEGDKFLCPLERAMQLGKNVRILQSIHDPVMKDFIAPHNTMIKSAPIRKAKVETEAGTRNIPMKPEYICSICGKKFSSKIGLIGHSRTHRKKE